ncbi:MFS transporter [Actinobacillus succinogenes]|uniref:Sugar (Glycoside-Pentoside-Hexuronide) transporter n=1 Tax=Actinobacillus succinogenes (strain ATCC 55618 / DSM 22257 / CCUG 43843 / 130Z) TaxID=339671 RepID=A6VKL1_ACTSZ|nr:glycoside-pentoside-hexuronide (GPH):cation symporter [Actinobacillus succinogenes]ABR73508.1 sugar (Glycoside-Pentoside-Hexuronide) transporter [Actinobacillus succinogenes 130Z]PHI40029.1 MFS transporter [Actinobacillus succinogenes]
MNRQNKWLKRIGYGFGDFGCNLVFSTMASYLMFFYTDVFGIEAAVVGTMMLSTRLLDAVTDVLMGLVVDRTHTRWGSGRPYFVIGAIPFAIFTTLTFYVPDFGTAGKIIWAYCTYIMLSLAYTVVNIPLNTIVPRLTSDINERNILVASRMICALLGTTVVMGITQPLVDFFGGGDYKQGYFITMTVYGVLAMLIFFFTFTQTEEVVPPTVVRSEKSSVWDDFRGLTSQSWILVLVNFFYFGLFVVRNTSVIYYFTYNLNSTGWLTFVGFFGILSGLPILLLLPRLQKIFPQRTLIIACCALYLVGDAIAYIGKDSLFLQLTSLAVTGLGMYGIFGVTFAIQPDVIDYSEYEKNRSIPGMIASMQGFFVKFGMGVAGLSIGWILEAGGYQPNVAQTDSALFSIEVCYIWIPVIICLSIVALMSFYKLDGLRSEMSRVLDLRRKQMEYADKF